MVQAQLNITIRQDRQPTCFGYTDAQVSAIVAGGTAPYGFVWSSGSNNPNSSTLTGIGAGNYTVTVTDNGGLSAVQSFSVTQPTVLSAAPASVSGNACAATNESYAANATGGVAPYTYRWYNVANATVGTAATQLFTNAGQYYVAVTDAQGCSIIRPLVVNAPLVATFDKNDVSCGGMCDGSVMAVVTGGKAPYDYHWNFMPMTPPGNMTNLTSVMFPVPGGSYSCTITDGAGCVRTITGSVYEPTPVGLNLTITAGNLCTGNASIQAVGTGGFAGTKTYILTGQNNTPLGTNTTGIFTNLGIGEYHLVVKDPHDCPKDTLFSIRDMSTLNVTAIKTDASCTGVNNGSATAQISGGNGPWRYVWSNGATSAQIVNLAAGNYTVSVYDGLNCFKTASVTIGTVSNLTLTTTGANAACTNNNGSARVAVQNGTAPYTYAWSNGATTANATQLGTGSYVVTVIDANGCRMISNAVVITATNALTATGTSSPAICTATNGSIQITPTSGTAPYNYVLNGSNNATGQFTNLAAGSYTVAVSDANGCNATTSVAVTADNRTVTINPTVTNTSCRSNDGRIDLTATGSTNYFQYTLSGTPTVTNTTGQFVGLASGSYNVTVVDGNGCRATTAAAVSNGGTALTCGATTVVATCTSATGGFTITSGGGRPPYTYTMNGAVYNSPVFTGLTAGDYSVTMTDANGCQLVSVITVPRNTVSINLNVNATPTGCTGSTGGVTASANGGTAPYRYTLNGVTNTSGIFANLSAGNFNVSVADANGCQNTVATQVTTNSSNITATAIGSSTFCGTSNGSLTFTAAGGTAPYSYTLNGVTNTTGTFTNLSANSYTVSITDATGCQGTRSAIVTNHNSTLSVTATPNAANCNGLGSITVTSTGGTAPYTYTLNGVSNTTGQFTGLAAAATAYNISVRDANGCNGTATATVNSISATITTTATTTAAICNSATGGIQVVSTGGTSPYTYTLNGVSNTTGQFTGLSASVTPYNVTVRDANGCTGATTATISGSSANITATATSTPAICTNNTGSLTITASGGNLPYTYATNGTSNTDGLFDRLAAGTYAITITDANGCQNVQSQSITATNPTITPTVNTGNTTCTGNDGRITISAIGGTNSYRFELPSFNNTNGQFTGLAAGNYVVTVVDGNGCRATANATVNNGANAVTATSTTTPAICTNNNGVIVVTGAGGTAPYTYTLNGASNSTGRFENLAGNRYSIEIVDAGNCRTTANVTLPVNNINVLATVTAGSATCRGNDGGLTVVATGGNGVFWYAVSGVVNSNTTGIFTGLAPGTYTVISTDGNGCQARSTGLIQDGSRLLNPTVQATTPAVCTGNNGTANLNVTGGTGNYSYILNGVTNSTGIFAGLASGNYTATITDGTTCRTTVPVTIGATTSNVVLTSDRVGATSCTGNDGSIAVSASGGTSPYTYRLNTTSNTTGQFRGLSANTYIISVADANGCTSTVSATVNAATGLLATTADLQIPTCRNANGSFRVVPSNGTAPYTYRLGSETNQTGVFTNLRTGDYVVTVTDANNCVTALPAVNLQSVGSIAAALTTTPVRCTGDSVTIRFTDASTVSGGGTQFNRNWLFGNGYTGTANNLELTFSTRNANVRLIVTSTQGCADTISRNMPVGLLEVAIQDTATNCQNTTVNVAATNNSLGDPVRFTWTPSHLIASGGNTANPRLTVGTTRQTVYVSITNGVCTKTDSVVINPIIPSPVDPVLVTNHSDCTNGLRVDFSNTNTNAGAYRWVFGDPANPTAGASSANASYTYGAAGTYTAILIPSAACLDTIRRTVTVQNGSAVQLRTIPNYATGVNYCDANITVQVRVRTNATTVRWSTDRNFTRIIGTDTLANIVPSNGATTFYVEGRDARGCRTVDSTKLIDRSVGVDVDDVVGICSDGIGHLRAENRNSRDTLTIMWTPPTGVTVVKGQGELKADVSGTGTGYVYGFFRNQWGCTKLDSVKVDMIHMTASLTARDTVVAKGDTTILTVTPGAGTYTYNWNPNVTTSGSPVSIKPDSTRTYYVIVTDTNGCKAMAKVLVKVYSPECRDPFIYIPNAFSPNGDGNNEKLFVRGENLKQQCYFAVYNRWGEIVFESYDKEIGWNGLHKDTPVCPDVYGYYLRGTCKNGEPIFIKGNITVLK
jgi:large repetitive protein